MSTEPLTLFDLPSKAPCKTWSLNPWKTRLLLNYKGIDYRTEWTEYPDIKTKLQDHVTLPEGSGTYTIPTIRAPNGTYIMDSMKIAKYIEEKYPSPSINLGSTYLQKLVEQMAPIMASIRTVFLPLMPERLLNPSSVGYWHETRSKVIGKPLSELTEDERGDKAWDAAKKHVQEISRLLRENSDGPFFEGKTVTYADFHWAGFLLFWERIGAAEFEKLLEISGEAGKSDNVHLQLLDAVKPWSARSDH